MPNSAKSPLSLACQRYRWIFLLFLVVSFFSYFSHALAPAPQSLLPSLSPSSEASGAGAALSAHCHGHRSCFPSFVARNRAIENVGRPTSSLIMPVGPYTSKTANGALFLRMIRGGGDGNQNNDEEDDLQPKDYSDDENSSSDDGESSSDRESNDPEVTTSSDQLEMAQKEAQLSQQSRNFGIATALWSSLFFDCILNKSKRGDLFPTQTATPEAATVVAKMIPTALLASGFALASGVAFLLWRDFDVQSEMVSSEQDAAEINKGDWFLSLSSTGESTESDEEVKFASQIRRRLCFHLSLFGLLSLGAHAGNLFSVQAPFLGMSAAIINVHNTLVCVSALMKERGVVEEVSRCVALPLRFFQGGFVSKLGNRQENLWYNLFQLSATFFWFRCIPVCKTLLLLVKSLMSERGMAAATSTYSMSASLIDDARMLSLEFASLARLTLFTGAFDVMSTSVATNSSVLPKLFGSHPFFATLSGIISLSCLGVGGTMICSVMMSPADSTGLVRATLLGDAALFMLTGLLSGYNSISEFWKRMKKNRN